MDPNEKCKRIRQRVAIDKKNGKTTPNAAIDFIRRTCSCVVCAEWRRGVASGSQARA